MNKRKKSLFLLIDALFALTLAVMLSLTIAVFSQYDEPRLSQLHQLGRDYLVLKHKQNVNFDFEDWTRFNETQSARAIVGSSVIVYPRLCVDPPVPDCFASQDVLDSLSRRKPFVFNATVSP